MTPSLETILRRMEQSSQTECNLVAEQVSHLLGIYEEDEVVEAIDASMDEIIAAAKIVKAWAQKGVPA